MEYAVAFQTKILPFPGLISPLCRFRTGKYAFRFIDTILNGGGLCSERFSSDEEICFIERGETGFFELHSGNDGSFWIYWRYYSDLLKRPSREVKFSKSLELDNFRNELNEFLTIPLEDENGVKVISFEQNYEGSFMKEQLMLFVSPSREAISKFSMIHPISERIPWKQPKYYSEQELGTQISVF